MPELECVCTVQAGWKGEKRKSVVKKGHGEG